MRRTVVPLFLVALLGLLGAGRADAALVVPPSGAAAVQVAMPVSGGVDAVEITVSWNLPAGDGLALALRHVPTGALALLALGAAPRATLTFADGAPGLADATTTVGRVGALDDLASVFAGLDAAGPWQLLLGNAEGTGGSLVSASLVVNDVPVSLDVDRGTTVGGTPTGGGTQGGQGPVIDPVAGGSPTSTPVRPPTTVGRATGTTVRPPVVTAPSSGLPATGSDPWTLVRQGVLLVVLGAVLVGVVVGARRRLA